ncbi:hypothetical protein C8J56DRAFT_1113493 [Mycena floridula]|nr:hypothetical protein C8J56DRAFT_1113493 [Mycena floridula]
MSPISTVSLEVIKSSEDPKVKGMVLVLKEAFKDMGILFDGDPATTDLWWDMDVRAIISGGNLVVAVDKTSGNVVGVAGWFPPGTEYLADKTQQKDAQMEEFFTAFGKVSPLYRDWWKDVASPINPSALFPHVFNDANKHLGKDAKLNNWNLYSLGVLKAHRNRGIATQLIKYAEDKAAKTGNLVIPSFLGASRSQKLTCSGEFEVLNESMPKEDLNGANVEQGNSHIP